MMPKRIRLTFACPGDTCSKSIPIKWQHVACGTRSYIDWDGNVSCDGSLCQPYFIQYAKFNCQSDEHVKKHGQEFVTYDRQDLWDAINYARKAAVLDPQLGPYLLQFLNKIDKAITNNWKTESEQTS